MIDCIEECKERDECRDILYNYADRTCLTNDDLIGTNRKDVKQNDKWIMLSKNRPSFNQPEFKFTLIGRNKQLAVEHNQFITLTQTFPKNDPNGLNKCLKLCLENDNNSDTCNLVQVERSTNFIRCKLYNIDLFNQTINSDDILFSNLYLITLNKNFNQYDLDQMPIMSDEDAKYCEIDKESILLEMLYLNSNNQSTALQTRFKRSIWSKIGNFFKGDNRIENIQKLIQFIATVSFNLNIGVGKAIVDTGKKIVKSVVGGAKAIGKLVTGDAKGALKEIKATPIYKEGENLVKNIKNVGEGIVTGNFKKIGKGLLGVATNDLLSFIPGQKVLSTGAKAITKGVKETVKSSVKRGSKKDGKHAKNDIVENNFKKKDHDAKNKKDKKKECKPKKGRTKRASDSSKKDDCSDDDDKKKCKKPDFQQGSGTHIIKSSLHACMNSKPNERCFYLCNAGYDEKPDRLICGPNERWSANAACVPQVCEPAGVGKSFILVKSSTISSVFDKKKGNSEVPLYLVLYDKSKKLPIYSVAYYKFVLASGKVTPRTDNFRPHPCVRLNNKQAVNRDYSRNNPRSNKKSFL